VIFDATFSVTPGRLGEITLWYPMELEAFTAVVEETAVEVRPVLETITEEYDEEASQSWSVFKSIQAGLSRTYHNDF